RRFQLARGKRLERVQIRLGVGRKLIDDLYGAQESLRGNTRPVGTLAPDQLAFDDTRPHPGVGRPRYHGFTRRSRADYDYVKGLRRHERTLPPPSDSVPP